jgi:hypothetical protein
MRAGKVRKSCWYLAALPALSLAILFSPSALVSQKNKDKALKPEFQTSDRCLACHNGLTTPSGKDVSIGLDWRPTIMANSGRDPYWQASVRREDLEHPESKAKIEDECAACHMPMARYEAKVENKLGEVFAHLPFDNDPKKNAAAEDGVSCSVCHQIGKEKLGTKESFNGGFVVDPPRTKGDHPEYGPYQILNGQARVMQTSSEGFRPNTDNHIQDSALCATCHTLYTRALAPGGKELGLFPEQVPFLEWQHSDYGNKSSCQSCHMPEVGEDAPISRVFGVLRSGVRQHTFVGANFFMLKLLNIHSADLSVKALPQELTDEVQRTVNFLQSRTARVIVRNVDVKSSRLQLDVQVENLTGHKFPTAYPSRRAWLHVAVRDRDGRIAFESGAIHADGSIEGNDNDTDAAHFEPHYREITSSDQVQIYEPILGDQSGKVTTGLSNAVGYLKDNRLLPAGFKKENAEKDIAVTGDAADDPNFTDAGDLVRYSVPLNEARGPLQIDVELWYQPIGYRWAHNLAAYDSAETHRFVKYYEANPADTAIILAHATAIAN